MNKTITLILIFLAAILIAYNITLLDFDNLFEGDSLIAAIGIKKVSYQLLVYFLNLFRFFLDLTLKSFAAFYLPYS